LSDQAASSLHEEVAVKAVVFKEPFKLSVEEVEDPKIEQPLDAVIRITTANICGSDLHPYEGRAPLDSGMVLGHENTGVVEEARRGRRRSSPTSCRWRRRCGPTTSSTSASRAGRRSCCIRPTPPPDLQASFGSADQGVPADPDRPPTPRRARQRRPLRPALRSKTGPTTVDARLPLADHQPQRLGSRTPTSRR
jgi:hypothetical protein